MSSAFRRAHRFSAPLVAILLATALNACSTTDGPVTPVRSQPSLNKGDLPLICCLTKNQRPTATITSPHTEIWYRAGVAINFTGFAVDPEQGALTGAALVWRSNLEGQIGTGTSFTRTLSGGIHTITLTATDNMGWIGVDTAIITVVRPMTAFATTTGSGLQREATLQLSPHTDAVTVTISSANPWLLLISPDATTPGAASTTVHVAAGQTIVHYFVAGIEGATGTTTVALTAPAFAIASADITVIRPTVTIDFLNTSTTVASGDDMFGVQVGLSSDVTTVLPVRAGANPLIATVTSSNAAVGLLAGAAGASQEVTAQINPLQFRTAGTIAEGGVAFRPVGVGTTTVSATIPGLIPTGANSPVVTVSP